MRTDSNALLGRLHSAFVHEFGQAPELLAQAPGRVNLIGEHTDYNDGFVLPCAISTKTVVALRRRPDKTLNVIATDLNESASFSFEQPILPTATAHWSNYIRGVAAGLLQSGVALTGADMVIAGNVPRGAGLSSSASLEIAVGIALVVAANEQLDATELARVGQQAERDFAGCQCGIMDQLVSARGVAGHALLIDCRSLVTTPVALANAEVLIVHSGITRGLVIGEYNARRAQCEAAARYLHVPALRDMAVDDLRSATGGLDAVVLRRARHVITENQRVLDAAAALRRGDLKQVGILMAQSHASMRDDFEITLPAIDRLVEILQAEIGEQGGARMTGGGFGGAVVAVIAPQQRNAVVQAVQKHYRTPEGHPPTVMIESACAGAGLLPL
jgi:galactokinase